MSNKERDNGDNLLAKEGVIVGTIGLVEFLTSLPPYGSQNYGERGAPIVVAFGAILLATSLLFAGRQMFSEARNFYRGVRQRILPPK